MKLSIIIVNWNTEDLLYNCLRSIYEYTQEIEFEVIVVDNNSSDNSVKMVRAEFSKVHLIENPENVGLAAAINQGLKIATGNYILLLNSDTIICEGTIDKVIQYADSKPQAGMVSCQVVDSNDRITMTSFACPTLWTLFCRLSGLAYYFNKSRLFGKEWMLWWDRQTEREVDIISGSFMLVRQEAIEQVGFLDDSFFLYFEETDWCFRFKKAGWEMLFWPGSKIIHVHGGRQSSKKESLRMFVQYHKSLLIFFKKSYGQLTYIFAKLMLIINYIFRTIGTMLSIIINYIIKNETSVKRDQLQKHWCVLKYLILGFEPLKRSEQINQKEAVSILFKIKRSVIDSIEFCLALVYGFIWYVLRKSKRRVIIYYHGVRISEKENFERQISYLTKNYKVLTLTELLKTTNNCEKPLVAITFDDGFKSVIENGLPVLKKHGLRASLFIPVGNMGKKPQWSVGEPWGNDRDELVIDSECVTRLDKDGFEIFSHTVTHPVLTDIDSSELEVELRRSRQQLEHIVGHDVIGISYPLGRYDKMVVAAARQAGYKYGFTVDPFTLDDSPSEMEIGRFVVNPDMKLLKFKLKVQGAYQVTSYLRKFKARVFKIIK